MDTKEQASQPALQTLKEYAVITAAVLIMDIGIYVFKFPNNFSFGGVSGMAVVICRFLPFTASQINLFINLLLLLVGFAVLGRNFGVKTAYVTVLSSVLLNIFEKLFPMAHPLTDEIMLELCFAIILPALAAALLFFENASGGGTDIIAMIIKKYSTMNISTALLVTDLIVVILAFLIFDTLTGLCSVLGLMAKTLLIDKTIERMKLNKFFTIISNNPQPICDFITQFHQLFGLLQTDLLLPLITTCTGVIGSPFDSKIPFIIPNTHPDSSSTSTTDITLHNMTMCISL